MVCMYLELIAITTNLNTILKKRKRKKKEMNKKEETLAALRTGCVSKPELWITSWAFFEASETAGEAIFKACSPAWLTIGNATSMPGFRAFPTTSRICRVVSKKLEPTSWTLSIVFSTYWLRKLKSISRTGYELNWRTVLRLHLA